MPAVPKDVISMYRDWWNGTNTNALMYMVYGRRGVYRSIEDAGLLKPWMEGSSKCFFARAVLRAYETEDLSPISDALDIMEHCLGQEEYVCAGYPFINLNTGPGCVAAFITGYAKYGDGTVWHELEKPMEYDEILSLPADCTNRYAETTMQAVAMAAERFKGHAVLMPLDIGGVADVLSSLRRIEGLFYDMVDRPHDVKAALGVIQKIWKFYHDRINAIIEPANEGLHTSWTCVLSDDLYFPSQCDASAMISPHMFKEIMMPSLSDEFSSYNKSLYHLDGSGQIPHIDMICGHPSIHAIQWVPSPSETILDEKYYPLYKKIIEYDKKIVFCNWKGDISLYKPLFTKFPKKAFFITSWVTNREEALRLEEYLNKP